VKFFSSVFLFILLISCATSPKTSQALTDGTPDFSILPAGASLYLWADVDRAKPLLQALSYENLDGRNASQVLDRTDTAMAAFYGDNASRRFFLAGWGNYPNLRAGASMSFSRDWKKVKSETGNRYWHSKANNLGIALGSKVAFASDGDPFAAGQGSNPAPERFEELRRVCVLSGWLNNPGDTINRFIYNLGIPIQIPAEELYFGAVQVPVQNSAEHWELLFKIKTPSAANARSLLSLFSVARLFVQRGAIGAESGAGPISPMDAASLFFANIPEQDEEFLTLRLNPLGEERIALLFSMFSVYSNKQ
jgi:hypothetical protein